MNGQVVFVIKVKKIYGNQSSRKFNPDESIDMDAVAEVLEPYPEAILREPT